VRKAIEGGERKEMPTDIYVTVGTEQEVFIIDKATLQQRPDLSLTGRTLFSSPSPKGQELLNHYWGKMPAPILNTFEGIQQRLYEYGVPVATIHNEVGPCQFEIAPSFERASVCSDHNMLLMEVMEEECEKRGLSLLLHEKPFANVNGSGKHINWSLATNTGENLLFPGDNPCDNLQFLFFFSALVRAVSLHSSILRSHIAVPGNEFRLGGLEAPPAVISIFTGMQLEQVVSEIISDVVHFDQKKKGSTRDLG
jgi:glutamine synthetase